MFNLPFFNRKHSIKPTVLVVLDGFGIAPPSDGNAVALAKTLHLDFYKEHYPHGAVIASGEAVGLPTNEVGNTEVGHLTLGAGRVVLQDLKRINVSIAKGTFYDNKALVAAAAHVKSYNSKLHILGLVSTGKVHSSIEHLQALLQFCKKEDVENVCIHAFTDGRDAPPKEGIDVIKNLENTLDTMRIGKIASLSGRYYAMDRDRRWARTEKTYRAIVEGKGLQALNPEEAIRNAYTSGKSDEFIEPTLILNNGSPLTIDDNDAVIFFNYRIDRAKQLTMSLVLPEFETIKQFDFGYDAKSNKRLDKVELDTTFVRNKIPRNLFFVTMTEYQKNLPVSQIAFAPEVVDKSLPQVLSESGLQQMHMAESEKERFVSYYFRGMKEEKVSGEDILIVPSPKVATYDLQPEMSLPELVKQFKKQLNRDKYHFFVLNFANADMVGHTGNIHAAINAIETIDTQLNELVQSVLKYDGSVIVTADHGNAEEMLSYPSSTFFYTSEMGVVSTDHSANPVPVLFISNSLYDVKVDVPKGQLSDIAPTILALLGIPVPGLMTGNNLLDGIFRSHIHGM